MSTKQIACALIGLGTMSSWAQDAQPLDIFGFYQVTADYRDDRGLISAKPQSSNSGQVQQLNLLMSKDFGNQFSGLVNLEWLNDFDFSNGVGGARVSEAWVGWDPSPLFKVRFGKLIPEYTEFSQIKDKMPLHPYIIRPLIYEGTVDQPLLDLSAWSPTSAWFQVSGTLPLGSTKLKYAAFTGNSDNITSSGRDTTTNLMYGGRLGVELLDGDLKIGVAGTFDKARLQELEYVVSRDQNSVKGGIMLGLDAAQEGLSKANAGLEEIDAGLTQISGGLTQINGGLSQINAGIQQLDAALAANAIDQATYDAQANPLKTQKSGLETQKAQLEATQTATQAKKTEVEGLKKQAEGMEQLFVSELDKANKSFAAGAPIHVDRVRLAADFSYEAPTGTVIQGEYVKVSYNLDDKQESQLSAINHSINFVQDLADDSDPTNKSYQLLYNDLDRDFYSLMLGQKIGEQWFVFASTSRFTNNWYKQLAQGLAGHSFGLTYTPVDFVSLKAQYSRWGIVEEDKTILDFEEFEQLNQYSISASVMF